MVRAEERGKVLVRVDSAAPHSPMWWFPAFDGQVLRLANAWPKVGQKVERRDVDYAVLIRREDLDHDR
ncbi:hypothetical protein [Nocardioides sp. Bht2]|uniref:hypothetical protein n=1 Tax=Nocardioides sp. Bht2 TaxID=3392297 RepID=UPI0039B3D05A